MYLKHVKPDNVASKIFVKYLYDASYISDGFNFMDDSETCYILVYKYIYCVLFVYLIFISWIYFFERSTNFDEKYRRRCVLIVKRFIPNCTLPVYQEPMRCHGLLTFHNTTRSDTFSIVSFERGGDSSRRSFSVFFPASSLFSDNLITVESRFFLALDFFQLAIIRSNFLLP